jgi:hypothetical protein
MGERLVEPGGHGIESIFSAFQDLGNGVLAFIENILDLKNKTPSLATKPLYSVFGVLFEPNARIFAREWSEEHPDPDPDTQSQQKMNCSSAIVGHLCLLNSSFRILWERQRLAL